MKFLQELAEQMLGQLIAWIMVDSSSLGSAFLISGTSELGHPMMLLNVLQEVCGDDTTRRSKYENEIKWSFKKVLTHLQVRAKEELNWMVALDTYCRETITGYVKMLEMMVGSYQEVVAV